MMLLAAAAALAAAKPWEVPQQRVALPDGRRINLYCTGRGAPTVLLEAGFGATTWSWASVQPLVARTNRVCSYDRAGMGFSDPGPLPRDGAAIVADLKALIAAAGLKSPFVLVGHSAGGMTMRLFADAEPGAVAGMVLVDPSMEGQDDGREAAVAARVRHYEACAAAAAAGLLPSTEPRLARCDPPLSARVSPALAKALHAWRQNPAMWRTQASEFAAIGGANSTALRAGRQNYGSLPLIVLTSAETAAQDPRWLDWHKALARRSTRGAQRLVQAPHISFMSAQPQAVADAIAVVAKP